MRLSDQRILHQDKVVTLHSGGSRISQTAPGTRAPAYLWPFLLGNAWTYRNPLRGTLKSSYRCEYKGRLWRTPLPSTKISLTPWGFSEICIILLTTNPTRGWRRLLTKKPGSTPAVCVHTFHDSKSTDGQLKSLIDSALRGCDLLLLTVALFTGWWTMSDDTMCLTWIPHRVATRNHTSKGRRESRSHLCNSWRSLLDSVERNIYRSSPNDYYGWFTDHCFGKRLPWLVLRTYLTVGTFSPDLNWNCCYIWKHLLGSPFPH